MLIANVTSCTINLDKVWIHKIERELVEKAHKQDHDQQQAEVGQNSITLRTRLQRGHACMLCCQVPTWSGFCTRWVRQGEQLGGGRRTSTRENIWHASLKLLCSGVLFQATRRYYTKLAVCHIQELSSNISLNQMNYNSHDGELHCYFVQKPIKVST